MPTEQTALIDYKDFEAELEIIADTIESGKLIPIVGIDLLKVDSAVYFRKRGIEYTEAQIKETFGDHLDEKLRIPLTALIAKHLADDMGVVKPGVTIEHIHSISKVNRFYNDVRRAIAEYMEEFPESFKTDSFEKLAKIKPIKMFLNASYCNFLEQNLSKYRNSCRVFHFYDPENQGQPSDIEVDEFELEYVDSEQPIVYNMFGQYFNKRQFIITEDDYIEFVMRMSKYSSSLTHFKNLTKLDDNSLVFLGCNFPNWLFRFFIRSFTDRKLLDLKNKDIIVSDLLTAKQDMDPGRMIFFDHLQVTTFSGMDTEQFVDHLYQYLLDQRPYLIDEAPHKTVFISYASEDNPAVKQIADQVVGSGVDVWFDESDLGGGDTINSTLKDAIDNSCVFMPVISNTSQMGDQRRHYRLEWDYAIKKQQRGELEIVPLVIDGVKNNSMGIPDLFWDKSCVHLDDSLMLGASVLSDLKSKQADSRNS